MLPPQAHIISGNRLHLHHGPIDLIIQVWAADTQVQKQAYQQATERFETVLEGLVSELAALRKPGNQSFIGKTALRMQYAVASHADTFLTPMICVAGAVADEICAAMCTGLPIQKAYVNNGGDIAIFLAKNQTLTAQIGGQAGIGLVTFEASKPPRGVATSGWQGRSHSFGIADAVTVVAQNSAMADVAATLIANAITLPHHPEITQQPANQLSPDSDLGDRLVTVNVGNLTPFEVAQALDAGQTVAQKMARDGLIDAAALFLKGQHREIGQISGPTRTPLTGETHDRLQTA